MKVLESGVLKYAAKGRIQAFGFNVVFYNTEDWLDWNVYTCLTQLYGGRDMYNLLHKKQLHVSALFIGHL